MSAALAADAKGIPQTESPIVGAWSGTRAEGNGVNAEYDITYDGTLKGSAKFFMDPTKKESGATAELYDIKWDGTTLKYFIRYTGGGRFNGTHAIYELKLVRPDRLEGVGKNMTLNEPTFNVYLTRTP
jgi:hypothetical protein